MLERKRKWRKAFFVLLLLTVSARLFTGAAEAQVNFLGIVGDANKSQGLAQEVDQNSLGVYGPVAADHRDASSIPTRHSDYKLYKKYVMPDSAYHIEENFVDKIQQLLVSIQATSYYIKDLTLKTLHSNSPPVPVSTFLFTVFMYLFTIRFGVLRNYGEKKNISDWRFSFQ